MYLRQKCPNCGTEKEYVYVQVGHTSCCKNCNYEFVLVKKRPSFLPYVIYAGVLVVAVGLLLYLGRMFHNWWIYR